MGEDREYKISLSTAICLIIIFIQLVAICIMYFSSYVLNKKDISEENIVEVENIVIETNAEEEKESPPISYEKISDKLPDMQGIYITDIEKNEDKYILKGVIYEGVVLEEQQTIWNLTERHMEIELDLSVQVYFDLYNDENVTYFSMEDLFNTFEYKDPEPNPSQIFNFEFEEGRCTKMYRILTNV